MELIIDLKDAVRIKELSHYNKNIYMFILESNLDNVFYIREDQEDDSNMSYIYEVDKYGNEITFIGTASFEYGETKRVIDFKYYQT